MKNTILKSPVLLFALMLTAFTSVEKKQVDTDQSIINWVGYKVTGQHEGTITLQQGSLEFNKGQLTGGNFVMDMTSINTTDIQGDYKKKLDGHLKADDFFGVEKHKKATLVFKSVTKNETNYSVVGDLTIKGITNKVSFELAVSENTATTTFQIDRTKFGIKYGSASFFDGLKDKAIYNEFDLKVSLKF
jgi:polyisoprenoid-binding protein YceI